MSYACPGRRDLNLTSTGDSFIPLAVLMSYCPFPDIGDDFHILMGMHWEACSGLDLVIIPYKQWRVSHFLGIIITSEIEMIMSIEPAVIMIS